VWRRRAARTCRERRIRASLTLKLREKLAPLGTRYKGFAKIAGC
jgi:hypothetical protein